MARQLQLGVLVIDDNVGWCKLICKQLTAASKTEIEKSGVQRRFSNAVAITFTPLSPTPGESAEQFRARFTRIIQQPRDHVGATSVKNLCCVVFDLELLFRNKTETIKAPDLAIIAKKYAPTLLRFLLTNFDPDDTVSTYHGLFDKPVRKTLLAAPIGPEVFVSYILDKLKPSLSAPYWDALQDFANSDKIVLHALANTDQRTRLNSVSIDQFSDAIGRGYFRTEASSTTAPLGSLLHSGHALLE